MQLLSDSIDLTRYCTLHLFEVYLNTFAKVHLLFSEPSNNDEYFLANGSIYKTIEFSTKLRFVKMHTKGVAREIAPTVYWQCRINTKDLHPRI